MKFALFGKMRSGKDSMADYAISKYGLTKFAFGDELKRYYHELFGESDSKPREGYQWIGQIMRQRDPEIWVRKCFEKIEMSQVNKIIITDGRQPNEFAKCIDEGYITIKVHCDDEMRLKRILEKNDKFDMKDLYHDTEMHIDTFNCDFVIHNNGSLEDLYKQFDDIIDEINT